MVKNFLPLLAAAASAQDSVLDVSLEIDQAEVARGSSVSYTCSWHLDADYGESKATSISYLDRTQTRARRRPIWPSTAETSKSAKNSMRLFYASSN